MYKGTMGRWNAGLWKLVLVQQFDLKKENVEMTLTYPIQGYPTVILTEDREQIPVRPMEPGDAEALLKFFLRIPEEDRAYLKDDVTSPDVINQWAEGLDYSRIVPLLAILDGRIIADGTLHHRRSAARKHQGEIRMVVDPEFRNKGLGRSLIRKLTEIAADRGLESVIFEVVADRQESARRAAQLLGFETAAVFPGHIQDVDGSRHNLIVMELDVAKVAALEEEAEEWY